MSRRRFLSDDERAVWAGFARSITPMRPSPQSDESPADGQAGGGTPPTPPRAKVPRAVSSKSAPPLAPLDRRFKQRVARGREPIEARLDLHGHTQTEARAELLRFLRRAQADGVKIALVVTGKGSMRAEGDTGSERGVLKRAVPMWLALPEFRALVVGFEQAHVGHGGQGALYVRLRRPR